MEYESKVLTEKQNLNLPELFTVAEVCDYLKITKPTLRTYVRQGLLCAYRLGPARIRFKREDVLGLLKLEKQESQGLG